MAPACLASSISLLSGSPALPSGGWFWNSSAWYSGNASRLVSTTQPALFSARVEYCVVEAWSRMAIGR